jgi:hypothetical protein
LYGPLAIASLGELIGPLQVFSRAQYGGKRAPCRRYGLHTEGCALSLWAQRKPDKEGTIGRHGFIVQRSCFIALAEPEIRLRRSWIFGRLGDKFLKDAHTL